ncbi:MAG: hypothetical protein Q9160_002165 [Pyrenula sp. 1 TL-2023]
MANRKVHAKLLKELKSAAPCRTDTMNLTKLEKLEYLTAIIHEGLRVSNVASHRAARIWRDKTFHYKGIAIRPGTEAGMTPALTHMCEAIYPDSKSFNPERWLVPDQQRLLRHLVPFNRGTRQCLGMNLAGAEMYLVLAYVFRRFEFDVSEIRRDRNIDTTRDFIIGAPSPESPGVVVEVHAVAD